MSATDELRRLLDERGVKWEARTSPVGSIWTYWDAFNGHRIYARDNENGTVKILGEWDVTPAQAIAATLGSNRLVFLEEKVRLQGDYIIKLTKENKALFAQSCEAATRHAGQIDAMQRKLDTATLGSDQRKCHNISDFNPVDVFTCSECGSSFKVRQFKIDTDGILDDETEFEFVPMHCPWCGAKVVDE